MTQNTQRNDEATTEENNDATTPEDAAAAYADDPSQDAFDDIVEAVRDEYDRDDHDPEASTVLTPVGLAARLAADQIADGSDVIDDAWSSIDFDGSDEVTIEYDSFAQDDTHADPMSAVRLATYADDATDRTVRFRGGCAVNIYVEVPERREDDEDDEDDDR